MCLALFSWTLAVISVFIFLARQIIIYLAWSHRLVWKCTLPLTTSWKCKAQTEVIITQSLIYILHLNSIWEKANVNVFPMLAARQTLFTYSQTCLVFHVSQKNIKYWPSRPKWATLLLVHFWVQPLSQRRRCHILILALQQNLFLRSFLLSSEKYTC